MPKPNLREDYYKMLDEALTPRPDGATMLDKLLTRVRQPRIKPPVPKLPGINPPTAR